MFGKKYVIMYHAVVWQHTMSSPWWCICCV